MAEDKIYRVDIADREHTGGAWQEDDNLACAVFRAAEKLDTVCMVAFVIGGAACAIINGHFAVDSPEGLIIKEFLETATIPDEVKHLVVAALAMYPPPP